MLKILGVARDSHEALFFGEEGNCTDTGLVCAVTGLEVVGDPVMHSIDVVD